MSQRKKTFDTKCFDLAVHFYTDYPPRGMTLADEEAQLDDLASTIQQAVEDWFEAREAGYDKDLGRPVPHHGSES